MWSDFVYYGACRWNIDLQSKVAKFKFFCIQVRIYFLYLKYRYFYRWETPSHQPGYERLDLKLRVRRKYEGFWVRVFLLVHTESQLGTAQVMVKLILVGMTTLCIFYLVVAEPSWTWDAGVFITLSSIICLKRLVFRKPELEPLWSLTAEIGERAERMPQRRTRKHKQSRKWNCKLYLSYRTIEWQVSIW